MTREAGPSWGDGKGAFEQPAVDDHAVFMNGLASNGVVLFAGPLAGGEHDRIRVLLIAEAPVSTSGDLIQHGKVPGVELLTSQRRRIRVPARREPARTG